MIDYQTQMDLRRKYRRLALYTLLIFIVASSVIHFTLGSIIAMLKHDSPAQAQALDQTVTIITISRAPEHVIALRPVPIVPRKVAIVQHNYPKPLQLKQAVIHHFNRVLVASSAAPASASKGSSAPKQQSGGHTSIAEVVRPTGLAPAPAEAVFTNSGSGGQTSGQDPNYPGRQVPTGAVWADDGPPGQGATAGGITLGGGRGGPDHGSCTPTRGGF
jgi:hypothetical protein